MAKRTCELSVIIPAYNEERRISETIARTSKLLGSNLSSYQLIVVNDGSLDHTAAEVERTRRRLRLGERLVLVSYRENQGKGWALQRGFEASTGHYVAFFDADLEIAPDHILRYLDVLRQTDAAAVVGSKRHKDSVLEYSRIRKLISWIYFLFNRIFFGLRVRDTQSGIKLFQRDALVRVMPRLLVKRFAFDLELLVNIRRHKGQIVEEPVDIRGHRHYGTIGVLSLWNAFLDTMAILYRLRVLRYYDWPCLPQAHRSPRFSLLLSVHGYSKRLEELVEKYRELNYENFEILLLADKGAFRIAGTRVVETGSLPLGEKWNMGARAAKGSLLVFLDESVTPDDKWLERAAGYFAYDEYGALCGPLEPRMGQQVLRLMSGWVKRHPLQAGSGHFHYKLRRQREVAEAPLLNLMVRRTLFQTVGGFQPADLVNHRHQSFFARLQEAGYSVLYSPDLRAFAEDDPLFPDYFGSAYQDALLDGYRCYRFPRRFCHLREFLPAFLLTGLLFGGVLSLFVPVFRSVYLTLLAGYYLLLVLGCGFFPRVHLSLITALAVLLFQLSRGYAFIKGIFSERISLPEEIEEDQGR